MEGQKEQCVSVFSWNRVLLLPVSNKELKVGSAKYELITRAMPRTDGYISWTNLGGGGTLGALIGLLFLWL